MCKDLGSIEACNKNSLSRKLYCLIFKLAFGDRSLLEVAKPAKTIRYGCFWAIDLNIEITMACSDPGSRSKS
jgi:hypothetical protein